MCSFLLPAPCNPDARTSHTKILPRFPPSNTSLSQDVHGAMLLGSKQERNSEESFTCMEEGDPQPSISLALTPSEGAAVDLDLLEQLLAGDNTWLEVAANTSRSPNFLASPSNVLSDAIATTITPANTWWIQSSGGAASSSVRERFNQALAYIRETQSDADVLVQLWVPVNSHDGKLVLTTSGQPFTLDKSSDSLKRFREVSTKYQFSADVASGSSPGLPGRVFIGRLPEWSPDVRYFSSYEYPRVSHAQYLDVHGTMGLPVFEKGSYSCLGVIELIMTRQKLNFTSELNSICSALQAVNLRSTEVSSIPRIKFNSASYKDALSEILEVIKAACITHKLPLAQTWVTCAQQGKRGSRHSDENYQYCISTIDAACFVNETQMQGFQEACSEHHLLREQGVAGKAFTTNQPCFVPDIGSSTKLEYPLAHHAKIFNLKGAVAIRLRCTRTGMADFVLEFFLPTNCVVLEEQKAVLDSLSETMQNVCQTLRVVTDKEMEDEVILEMNELNSFGPQGKNKVELCFGNKATEHRDDSSWTNVAGISHKESDLVELQMHGLLSPGGQGSSLAGDQTTAEGVKVKRRTKTEKNVSLHVLRQYFAGSLKDAAKSLGVCPTTLKRICRQHGINRWPSRKIKKVDHSLRKLQQIIDSVHGAETAIQLNTMYKDLTNTSISSENNISGSVTVPPTNQSNLTDFEKHQHHRLSSNMPSTSHSHSSCSHSSDSSPSYSGGATKQSPQIGSDLMRSGSPVKHSLQPVQTENTSISEQLPVQEAPRDLLQEVTEKTIGRQHSSPSPSSPKQNADLGMRVKATFGSEKVRFKLKPECDFQELKQEITKRLSIVDTSSLIVKYLDDDSEWVLMTCDADLQECLHVYKLADIQTIKISVHLAANPATRMAIGHTALS